MGWPRGTPRPPGSGRRAGTPNKRAANTLLEAKRAIAEARAHGHKLAKEVADDFMNIFARLASECRPVTEHERSRGISNPHADEQRFKELSAILLQWVALLLPFQSAKFQSIRVEVGELGDDSEEVGALETLERLLDAYAQAQEQERRTIASQAQPVLESPAQPDPVEPAQPIIDD
jgi:hypothetical protein